MFLPKGILEGFINMCAGHYERRAGASTAKARIKCRVGDFFVIFSLFGAGSAQFMEIQAAFSPIYLDFFSPTDAHAEIRQILAFCHASRWALLAVSGSVILATCSAMGSVDRGCSSAE